jgi:hypothetical protein
MKKIVYFILATAFLGSVLTSCRSHQKCPAYGKANTEAATAVPA